MVVRSSLHFGRDTRRDGFWLMIARVFQPMKRVAVIGTSSSGKTTIASQLADQLSIPHTELDVLHWLPDWQMCPLEQFRSLVKEVVERDRWVIDGNYGKVRDILWPRATHLVWLNYPFQTVFSRALRRTFRRVATREELFAGNRENLRQALFDPESIVWWVVRTYRRRRREYPQLFQLPHNKHLEIIELKHPIDADRFLVGIRDG